MAAARTALVAGALIRPLRRAHRIVWWFLVPAVALILWAALAHRPAAPVQESLPAVLGSSAGGR